MDGQGNLTEKGTFKLFLKESYAKSAWWEWRGKGILGRMKGMGPETAKNLAFQRTKRSGWLAYIENKVESGINELRNVSQSWILFNMQSGKNH